MFSSQGTSSPFRSSGQSVFAPQQSQSQQQQPGAFAQPQQPYSPFSASSGPQQQQQQQQQNGHSQSFYGTPQYGAGAWGASSPAGGQGYSGPGQGQFGSSMSQSGSGATGTPSYGEKPKRNYLPGYLSGGAMAQAESAPPQNSGEDSRTWDSPVRRTSVSGSPATRFGGQSLFGGRDGTPSKSPKTSSYGRERLAGTGGALAYRTEMEEDAPPISSLGEYDGNDSMNSLQPDISSGHALSASPSDQTSTLPAQHSPGGYPVYIFGFPSSALEIVLEYFGQFGEIVSSTPSTEGGNWVTVAYAQPWSASRAARKNGEVLGGALMVGVKAVDEEGLRRALLASENSDSGAKGSLDNMSMQAQASSRPPQGASTPASSFGRPVNVLGPGSAFKAPAPTPSRRGFFGVGGGGAPAESGASTGNAVASRDPHASLFAEKSRQAMMQQQGQGQAGQKGVLSKVSDAIFGW